MRISDILFTSVPTKIKTVKVTTHPEKNSPILSIMDTIEFMKRIDLDVKKLDLKILHKAFKDFRLDYHPETNQLLQLMKLP
ncbi:hypothetical protein AP058_00043 [Flavobacterium sp. TAB 87]|nr:hypothetical protein AP058_00043 [Flavobacterium sp. TAB 87]